MSYHNIPELQNKTQRGIRYSELLSEVQRFDKSDIEAICYAIMDIDLANGKMRTDRPMPDNDKQKPYIKHMNESDEYWIYKLYEYKKDIDVLPNDVIPLSEYQKEWFDYILGKTNIKPNLPALKESALKNLSEEDQVPF